jgi:uncharacterized membrane protein YraQ (UPF0718 family)
MDSIFDGRSWRQYAALTVFAVILAGGLYYVKWHPYYLRSFVAASQHSIGPSILFTGGASAVPAPSWDAAWGYAIAYGKAIWQAMALGLLLGSGVQAAILPQRWIERLFGRGGFRGIAAGGLAAVPGMMCTCCTAPVVVGLRRSKSSVGSAMAFWLANPLLNPATLVFTGFVLGWQWVGLRFAFALLVVFGAAYLAERVAGSAAAAPVDIGLAEPAGTPEPTDGFFVRWGRELWRLSIRLLPEYVIIVLALGAARAWLFPTMPAAVGNDVLWIAAVAIAGTAFVIPTAGEVPIVQSLMALGLGSGPAAALLVTLPAVSVPAAVMVLRAFPQRVVWFVAVFVALSGLACGLVASGLGF